MKRQNSLKILLLGLLLLSSFASIAKADGRTVVYNSIDLSKKSIALVMDLVDGGQLFYEACLTQALINNGYTVMERVRLSNIMKELGLDVSGAVAEKRQNTAARTTPQKPEGDRAETNPNVNLTIDLTPSIIKKLGNIYGIKYLGFYGRFYNGAAYLRLVDAETSITVATSTYYQQLEGARFSSVSVSEFDMEVVNILVSSLESANKLKDSKVSPSIVITQISDSNITDKPNTKIISQKKIADKYYISYIWTDETPRY